MSFNNFYKQIIALIITFILIPILFIPTLSSNITENTTQNLQAVSDFRINSNGFVWPAPGYTKITSYFGRRTSPTKFASSFHQGIDIAAPTGTNLVAISDAVITYIGFNGAAGYSIHLKSKNFQFYYHHVSPNYIVSVNDIVKAGQLIGKVGPKNVYGIKNNPYKDYNGEPTNGATTGPHLHLSIKKDGIAVNPLNYF